MITERSLHRWRAPAVGRCWLSVPATEQLKPVSQRSVPCYTGMNSTCIRLVSSNPSTQRSVITLPPAARGASRGPFTGQVASEVIKSIIINGGVLDSDHHRAPAERSQVTAPPPGKRTFGCVVAADHGGKHVDLGAAQSISNHFSGRFPSPGTAGGTVESGVTDRNGQMAHASDATRFKT